MSTEHKIYIFKAELSKFQASMISENFSQKKYLSEANLLTLKELWHHVELYIYLHIIFDPNQNP